MKGFTCQHEGCDHTDAGNSKWCRMHYMRWWKHGDPNTVLVGNWTETPTYSGAHMRVRSVRGSAAAQACVGWGESAAHWSYNHQSSNEFIDPKGRPYSADPGDYVAMCVPCHKRADLARRPAHQGAL